MELTKNSFVFALIRYLCLVLVVFTGMTGLIYEVTWHRYLTNFLGSQAQATATILAVFLGGLAVGYAAFGKLSREKSPAYLMKVTGIIEVLIGVWAFIYPSLNSFMFSSVGVFFSDSILTLMFDIVIAILLIGFPTVLMGGTLPLLTQALSQKISESSTIHAKVYALNTGGAFVGCLIAGFVLLPKLGLANTMYFGAWFNVICGLVFWGFGYFLPTEFTSPPKAQEQEETEDGESLFVDPKISVIVAFLAGFYALCMQTVFVRLVGLTIGSSEYAFSMIVACYIFLLAWGAWRLANKSVGLSSLLFNQVVLLVGLTIIHLTVSLWPYSGYQLRILFSGAKYSFYGYHVLLFLSLAALLAIPVGAMGKTMPLLFSVCRKSMTKLGDSVGNLYGWNTFGAVCGAFIGGYLMLYIVDLDNLFRVSSVLIFASIALLFPWKGHKSKVAITLMTVSTLLFAATVTGVLPYWDTGRFASGLFRIRKEQPKSYDGPDFARLKSNVRVYEDGPNTTIAIRQWDTPKTGKYPFPIGRSYWVNGKSDGSTSGADRQTTVLLAHIPALLHAGTSGNAAIVGLGTGISSGAFTLFKEFKEIDILEISPTAKKHAHYFDFANHEVTKQKSIKWHIGDAYRILLGSDKKFSVILSEPSNPWVVGVEKLFSQEFYKLVAKKLDKGGLYAQWFHNYSLSIDTIGSIINTFNSVFRYVKIFRINHADSILIGSDVPFSQTNLNLMRKRLEDAGVKKELASVDIYSAEDVMNLELPLPAQHFHDKKVHTLEAPSLSYEAGKDFFYSRPGKLKEYMDEPAVQPWVTWYEDKTLVGLALRGGEGGANHVAMESMQKQICGKMRGGFFSDWERSSERCRSVLLSLAAEDRIDAGPHLKESESTLLKALLGKGEVPDLELGQIVRGLDFFLLSNRAYLPLKVDKVAPLVEKCRASKFSKEGFECRTKYVKVLAKDGLTDQAEQELEKLRQDYAGLPYRYLKETVYFVEDIKHSAQLIRSLTPKH